MNITITGYKIKDKPNGDIYIEEKLTATFPIKNVDKLEHAMYMADITNGNEYHSEDETWLYYNHTPNYTTVEILFDEDADASLMKDTINYLQHTIETNV